MKKEWIEILTEEPSMESFLRAILPKILPEGYVLDQNCFIRPHEGKSDLKRSIPRKVKSYPNFPWPVKLIIVHDQDSNDCKQLKNELARLAQGTGATQTPFLIRIACRELENWYLGDLEAVESVYPRTKASSLIGKKKYADPDHLFGSYELNQLYKEFSKSYASREIPRFMNLDNNTSSSFNHLILGIKKFLT